MELTQPVTERRRQTRSRIYRHLYQNDEFCSKQRLALQLEMSLPTVHQNLTELMDAGLVGYSGEQRSTGGRRAMGLRVIASARVAIGISISDEHIRFVAADLLLRELCHHTIPRFPVVAFDEFARLLAEELERFIDDSRIDRDKLLGVGVAQPGILNADSSVLLSAPTLRLKDVSLAPLYEAIPYPVLVQNDADCGGHAEWFLSRRAKPEEQASGMAYLLLEDGVGGSLFFEDRFYRGDHGRSAEFGHMPVEKGGLFCSCGKQGCLEAYCSARRCSTDMGISLHEFFRRLERGDVACSALWADMLQHLAVAVNNINLALDCDVVLGGALSYYLPAWLPRLRSYVGERNPFDAEGSFVRLSVLKSHSVPLGAALYFLRQFVDSI